MVKFLRLIGNEWKKQFYRPGIWIMLALLLLATLGYTLLIANSADDEIGYDTLQMEFESTIEKYSLFVDETDKFGNPTDFALEARAAVEEAEFWISLGVTRSDWRYMSGCYEEMILARESGNATRYEAIRSFLVNNDSRAYFQDRRMHEMLRADATLASIWLRHWDYCLEGGLTPDGNPQYNTSWNLALKEQQVLELERRIAKGELQADHADYLSAKDDAAVYRLMLEKEKYVNPADCLTGSLTGGGLNGDAPFWVAFAASDDLATLIGVFLIIIAGGIVSNEFSRGTIKFLLISPVKRWKLLMSKYAAVLLVGLLMLAVTLVSGFLGSLLGGGWEHLFHPAFYAENGIAYTVSPFLKVLTQYLWGCVEIVVMFSLAFAISSLFRSSAVAIGVSLFALLSGSVLVTLLQAMEQDWARYLIFANLDLEAIVNGASMFPHHSLWTALTVILLHMVVFLWTAIDGFVRREV